MNAAIFELNLFKRREINLITWNLIPNVNYKTDYLIRSLILEILLTENNGIPDSLFTSN